MRLDSDSQRALDLAKRAVPHDGVLDVGILISALYFGTKLKDRFPALATHLEPPDEHRDTLPDKVPVDTPLQPVLARVSRIKEPASAATLFHLLAGSEIGRDYLESQGVAKADVDEVVASLRESAEKEGSSERRSPDWRASPERSKAISALSSYGRFLTDIDLPDRAVYGIEQPLRSLVRTLSRARSRNAMVLGHPGTGKTRLVYEFAKRLKQRDSSIPEHLRDLDIFELAPSFLRAGASHVGEYDERVKAVIQVLEAHPKILLFVDEVHTLLRSGRHEQTPFTQANESFKAPLQRGTITMVGCTTYGEYRHYIEPDRALADRFTIVRVEPPTADSTVEILRSRRPALHDHFSPVTIPDDILHLTVEYASDYLPSRYEPRKSLQLLDEACAYCITAEPPLAEVTEEALWRSLESMIGHSVVEESTITEDEVYDHLAAKIIGQDETLHGIARKVVSGFGDWRKRSGPRGVFFFCGPTGVGKTETAKLLAGMLGRGEEALVRVNCNTLHGGGQGDCGPANSVLFGAPPGYIGFVRGEGGILSRIRDNPETVVLFDEIEKAHPCVGRTLLQMIDEGRLEDNEGNPLDFRRSFIVFTTNTGCTYDHRAPIGYQIEGDEPIVLDAPTTDVDQVKKELEDLGYRKEFFGRIDEFFVFDALSPEACRQIIDIQLGRLRESADVRGYDLTWENEAVEYLVANWQPHFGVRHLLNILRNRIIEQLDVADAQGELTGVEDIHLRVLGEPDSTRMVAGYASREREGDTLYINLA